MSGEAPNTNAVESFDFEWDPILSKALSDAEQRGYKRGRKEGLEEAAKVADRIGNQRSELRYLSILHGKPAAVDVGYVGYTIRQLLEVKSEDRVEKTEKT